MAISTSETKDAASSSGVSRPVKVRASNLHAITALIAAARRMRSAVACAISSTLQPDFRTCASPRCALAVHHRHGPVVLERRRERSAVAQAAHPSPRLPLLLRYFVRMVFGCVELDPGGAVSD